MHYFQVIDPSQGIPFIDEVYVASLISERACLSLQLHFIRNYLVETGGYSESTMHEDQARIEQDLLVEANR